MGIWRKLRGATGFDWDEGNIDKNWEKHQVSPFECEQLFFNRPLVVKDDEKHSRDEGRFYALGKTDAEKRLFLVFALRGDKIRVISARSMSRREQEVYERYE